MTQLIEKMREAHEKGELSLLTISNVESLKGKRIQTIYFGYNGQDGVDDFVVGEVLSEYDRAAREIMDDGRTRAEYWDSFMSADKLKVKKEDLTIITADGRDTFIRYASQWSHDGTFHCSDVDRAVFYRVVTEKTHIK